MELNCNESVIMSEDKKAQESFEDIRKLLRYVIKSSEKNT